MNQSPPYPQAPWTSFPVGTLPRQGPRRAHAPPRGGRPFLSPRPPQLPGPTASVGAARPPASGAQNRGVRRTARGRLWGAGLGPLRRAAWDTGDARPAAVPRSATALGPLRRAAPCRRARGRPPRRIANPPTQWRTASRTGEPWLSRRSPISGTPPARSSANV